MKRYSLIFVLLVFIKASIIEPLSAYSESLQTDESIEIYRKGDMILRCFDGTENLPVPNCKIAFKQISHDFLFAANPMGKANKYDPRYLGDLLPGVGVVRSAAGRLHIFTAPAPRHDNCRNCHKYRYCSCSHKSILRIGVGIPAVRGCCALLLLSLAAEKLHYL